MNNFNVNTIALEGCKLVEASAGTGKTYSVGILALRLLIEKNIKINQILMVTFTEAAVEELKSRIRHFVYQAWLYSQDSEAISEEGIKHYLDECGKSKTEIRNTLNEAVAMLDEVAIFTIHGFCARSLKEFAFETKQNFDLKMMTDISEIHQEALHIVWRKNITTLPKELLEILLNYGFSQGFLLELSKEILSGRKLSDTVLDAEMDVAEIVNREQIQVQQKETARKTLTSYMNNNSSNILKAVSAQNKNTNFYKNYHSSIESTLNNLDDFLEQLKKSKKQDAFNAHFQELASQYDQANTELSEFSKRILTTFYKKAAEDIGLELQQIKTRRNLQTFDDLIQNLHKAVTASNNQQLVQGLRDKYKAIFIDEFQDTDKLQYEIFSTAFSKEAGSILFYIGDPKQSIYAFRKADLDTYKQARAMAETFTMKSNFRSNQSLLDNLNAFFDIENPFSDPDIEYTQVECGKTSLGNLTNASGTEVPSFEAFAYKNKPQLVPHLVSKILQLLVTGFKIHEKGIERNLIPSDIGILVKSNREGRLVKQALGKKGIPAVVVNDAKIFDSEVSSYAIYILKAILEINDNAVRKALGTPLFIDQFYEIPLIDLEKEILHFHDFKTTFNANGVYSMFQQVLKTYNLRGNLLKANQKNGQRLITNLIHLIELLQNQQNRFKLSLEELIDWAERARNGGINVEGNFEQRLENDENAVSIVTIHKSKGLAYNVVFAPYLDKENSSKKTFVKTLRYKTADAYSISIKENNNLEAKDLQSIQWIQEDKRLIYVALTRAVYYCAIYSKARTDNPIADFVSKWKDSGKPIVNVTEASFDTMPDYNLEQADLQPIVLPNPKPSQFAKQWSVLSYSSIASHSPVFPTTSEQASTDVFEQFVFQKMPRGTGFGNFVHGILERISFQDQSRWDKTIHQAAQKSLGWGHKLNEAQETEAKLYHQWLHHICNTTIDTKSDSFKLSEVAYKISELEFYFDYTKIQVEKLKTVSTKIIDIDYKSDLRLEGLMNGFIDLVFQYNEKYYILDWKTNYLGNSLNAYQAENLDQAMSQNNYHLQYMMYTVALCRYLAQKLPNFDYETHFGGSIYLFVRGLRSEQNTGIFFDRFSKNEFEELEKAFK